MSNYPTFENKNKIVVSYYGDSGSMTFRIQGQLSKFNFDGLIIQLEQFFGKIVISFCLSLSETNVQQRYFKIYLRLTDI